MKDWFNSSSATDTNTATQALCHKCKRPVEKNHLCKPFTPKEKIL